METLITSFIGLDVHKDSIAIGLAAAGREAYFPHISGMISREFSGVD